MNLNIKHKIDIKSLFSTIKSLHGDKGHLIINNEKFEIENIKRNLIN